MMYSLDIEKHTPLHCEMLHRSVIFLDFFVCVSSGEEHCLSPTTIKLETFCSHLYLNPSYVTLLYRFFLSDLFTFTLPFQALVNSAGLECQ